MQLFNLVVVVLVPKKKKKHGWKTIIRSWNGASGFGIKLIKQKYLKKKMIHKSTGTYQFKKAISVQYNYDKNAVALMQLQLCKHS